MNLCDAVQGFLDDTAGEVSDSTHVWYRNRLRDFAAFAGDVCVREIEPRLLKTYRAGLIKRGLTEHSVHGYQRALRRFFGWLVTERIIDRNIARDVPFVRLPSVPPTGVSDDDVRRFLARLPKESPRDRAIILFLADTGCRVGGLCSVTLETIDLDNLRAFVIEKGRRGRFVFYSESTAEAIRKYLLCRPESEYDTLFLAEKGGRPLLQDGVRQMLRRVAKRAGVKGRSNPHSFRHFFAREYVMNGGSVATLQPILGHKRGSPVTAKYYAVFEVQEHQEFHRRYNPLAKLQNGV